MMKKVIKKLLAALLAVAMVCAMAIPAFAENSEGDVDSHHTYSAFQIFKGDVEGNNIKDFKISNVDWGSNIINNSDDFLNKLREADPIGPLFTNAKSAQEVLAVISQWSNSDDNSIAFARVVCSYLYPNADAKPEPVITDHTGGINIPKSGYYLIVDTTYFNPGDYYHAYNSFFLLNVPQVPYVVPINRKVVKPTVEKEVYDNQDGANEAGFGSSADHAINEEFQFKLTATLPANPDRAYDYYDEYMVTFCDTLSAGITFDRWDTVVINNGGADIPIPAENYYSDASNQDLTLSIEDVKTCAPGLNLNNGATITVTYTAHLNENAAVNGSADNKNKVQLQYSNNPRPDGEYWGYTPNYTPESEVYVYTYQLNNTKLAENEHGAPLKDVGFRLYSDADYMNEVELYQDGEFYYPIKNATGKTAVEMKSAADGTFNVKGLDAGTYYLKETKTPADYNPCDVPPVIIKANHKGNQVDLNGSTLSTTIINKKAGGITLPSTGGIGTTLFYVVGGGLMVAAIVLLVTKKRMENK